MFKRWSSSKWGQQQITGQLLMIILFLVFIAVGNLLGVYSAIETKSNTMLVMSLASLCVYAIPAYGLFFLKAWGRWLEIVISFLVVFVFSPLLLLSGNDIILGLLSLCIHGYIVIYLNSKECKALFQSKKKND